MREDAVIFIIIDFMVTARCIYPTAPLLKQNGGTARLSTPSQPAYVLHCLALFVLTCLQGVYTFHDGLVYNEGDWDYCDEDDRRFYSERIGGVQPAGMCCIV